MDNYDLILKQIDTNSEDIKDNRNSITVNRSDLVSQEVLIGTILDKLNTLIDKIDDNQKKFNRFIVGVISGVLITVLGGFILALIIQNFIAL